MGCLQVDQQYLVGRPVVILADNDDEGRDHAEAKAALAAPVATSVKVIHFRELEPKQDVSDWAAIAGNTLVELMARVERAEAWKPSEPAPGDRSIKMSDFQAYLPMHS
jgi:putative DNA primase/helicase